MYENFSTWEGYYGYGTTEVNVFSCFAFNYIRYFLSYAKKAFKHTVILTVIWGPDVLYVGIAVLFRPFLQENVKVQLSLKISGYTSMWYMGNVFFTIITAFYLKLIYHILFNKKNVNIGWTEDLTLVSLNGSDKLL